MPRLENAHQYRKATLNQLYQVAKEVVDKELRRKAPVFDCEQLQLLPTFAHNEVQLGKVVGRGGFAICRDIVAIQLTPPATTSHTTTPFSSRHNAVILPSLPSSELDVSSSSRRSVPAIPKHEIAREQLARRVWASNHKNKSRRRQTKASSSSSSSSSSSPAKYIIKQIDPETLHTDKVTYLKGTIDLALETHFLASLSHNHILSLRGRSQNAIWEWSGNALEESSPLDHLGYFIVLDRLQETLSKRLVAWMHQQRATQGLTGLVCAGGPRGKQRKVTKLYLDRLLVAFDIANAMDYLHRRNIVFRDLKPDNIGFSSEDGTLKLFDFGLAKVLLPEDAVESDDGDGSPCYRLTKFTGAIRYLSPENGLGLPYNLKADVYSWSMLLHYILALEPPMGTYTPNMFIERVFKQGVRPVIKDKWSPVLKDLLKQAWSESIDERPSFAEIMLRLKQEIASIDAHAASFLPEPNCGEPLVIVASASK